MISLRKLEFQLAMLKKLFLQQMMLITELMQGGDLGTKLRSDRETPRKTGWYRQGCYYALGVARSGANPLALILLETACCLASGCLPELNTSVAFLMVTCRAFQTCPLPRPCIGPTQQWHAASCWQVGLVARVPTAMFVDCWTCATEGPSHKRHHSLGSALKRGLRAGRGLVYPALAQDCLV